MNCNRIAFSLAHIDWQLEGGTEREGHREGERERVEEEEWQLLAASVVLLTQLRMLRAVDRRAQQQGK